MTIDTERPVNPSADLPEDAQQLTAKLRHAAVEALPPQKLMPDRQPAYVASWIYVFGILTVSALAVVILTGIVLAIFGPNWCTSRPSGSSSTRSICGASRCSSSVWSSTCGASSSWPPGAVGVGPPGSPE